MTKKLHHKIHDDKDGLSITKGELYGDCEQCMRTLRLETLQKHHGLCGHCATKIKKVK